MAELTPYPFGPLLRRLSTELSSGESVFDLPTSGFHLGDPNFDLAVDFHGETAASPLGPAAGPHTQMAQNIVLAWLGGSRILELKTVQVLDRLTIPRPCIDMRTVGYNAEWSQELRLRQSLVEYAKAAMLIEILKRAPELPMAEGFDATIYDMSVGYDLKGIRSEGVDAFIRGMMDATELIDELRAEIPDSLSELRQIEFPRRLSNTLTLSTFHGCPPEEIEGIIRHLMEQYRLHCVVKFNPMLLGPDRTRRILHDELGYRGITVPDTAFERDTKWDQAVAMMERLGQRAQELGLSLGAKFTNTLIVENDGGYLPSAEKEVYLSGQPLHVLAMNLVASFRETFGDRFPISFSAGIDATNFPDAVALGLKPVTVCSDLLKTGGYARQKSYYKRLHQRMSKVGAASRGDFILRANGRAEPCLEGLGLPEDDPRLRQCRRALREGTSLLDAAGKEVYDRWVSATQLANTKHYIDGLASDERYTLERNRRPPKKVGTHLELFDCLTCDKCVPVCPNDANFTLDLPGGPIPIVKLRRRANRWDPAEQGGLVLDQKHQIANFADFCNDCGNCDVFCPEDGGPYVVKPRFFGSEEAWRLATDLDGFFLARGDGIDLVLGRFDGVEYRWQVERDRVHYHSVDFELELANGDPGRARGRGPDEVDLTFGYIMDWLRRAVLDTNRPNYINSLYAAPGHGPSGRAE